MTITMTSCKLYLTYVTFIPRQLFVYIICIYIHYLNYCDKTSPRWLIACYNIMWTRRHDRIEYSEQAYSLLWIIRPFILFYSQFINILLKQCHHRKDFLWSSKRLTSLATSLRLSYLSPEYARTDGLSRQNSLKYKRSDFVDLCPGSVRSRSICVIFNPNPTESRKTLL